MGPRVNYTHSLYLLAEVGIAYMHTFEVGGRLEPLLGTRYEDYPHRLTSAQDPRILLSRWTRTPA